MKTSDIITALKAEREKLAKRIGSIDAALAGFGEPTNQESDDDYQQADSDSTNSNDKKYNEIEIPSEYTRYTSWQVKIAYVLNEMSDGAVSNEIADRIMELEPEFEGQERYVYSAVTQHSSRMFRDRLIDAVRVGRKYRYKLHPKREAE